VRFLISLLALRPGRIGGTETYIRELLAAMPAVADDDEVAVLLSRHIAAEVATPGLTRIEVDATLPVLMAQRMAEAFTPYRATAIEAVIARVAPDAVLFPQISMFPKHIPVPAVLTVGDVQHLVHPGNFAIIDRLFRAAIYPYSFRHAARILAISAYTRDQLVELAGVPADKIVVVPLGARAASTPAGAPPVAPPYLYFPAATNVHKGHDVLLASFAAAVREHGLPHRLVLTGQQTPHWRVLQRAIAELGITDRVVHLGFVARQVVDALYAGADAVVFPTRYEGFGLPVVEAAAAGTKVIASRLAVFAELGAVDVLQIDFEDPRQLAEAVASPVRSSLAASPWTWEGTARATLDALREAAEASDVGEGEKPRRRTQ